MERREVAVASGQAVRLDLAVPAAPEPGAGTVRAVVADGGPGSGFSVVRCRVLGEVGRTVRLWTAGWNGITQTSGSKTEYGPDACEFAPLGAGTYYVDLEERDAAGAAQTIRAEVRLPPNRVMWVRFERIAPALRRSRSLAAGTACRNPCPTRNPNLRRSRSPNRKHRQDDGSLPARRRGPGLEDRFPGDAALRRALRASRGRGCDAKRARQRTSPSWAACLRSARPSSRACGQTARRCSASRRTTRRR